MVFKFCGEVVPFVRVDRVVVEFIFASMVSNVAPIFSSEPWHMWAKESDA